MRYDSCMGCGAAAVCRTGKNRLDQAARAMKISIKTDSARVRAGSHSCRYWLCIKLNPVASSFVIYCIFKLNY